MSQMKSSPSIEDESSTETSPETPVRRVQDIRKSFESQDFRARHRRTRSEPHIANGTFREPLLGDRETRNIPTTVLELNQNNAEQLRGDLVPGTHFIQKACPNYGTHPLRKRAPSLSERNVPQEECTSPGFAHQFQTAWSLGRSTSHESLKCSDPMAYRIVSERKISELKDKFFSDGELDLSSALVVDVKKPPVPPAIRSAFKMAIPSSDGGTFYRGKTGTDSGEESSFKKASLTSQGSPERPPSALKNRDGVKRGSLSPQGSFEGPLPTLVKRVSFSENLPTKDSDNDTPICEPPQSQYPTFQSAVRIAAGDKPSAIVSPSVCQDASEYLREQKSLGQASHEIRRSRVNGMTLGEREATLLQDLYREMHTPITGSDVQISPIPRDAAKNPRIETLRRHTVPSDSGLSPADVMDIAETPKPAVSIDSLDVRSREVPIVPKYSTLDTRPKNMMKAPDPMSAFRGYGPVSSTMFDDDPGIMSEAETASTGFRRGGKQRSSLPVVRTPSKTLEKPLGLVFLQFRNETKRALLPNEITSLDTVRALFVRSFIKQLTMDFFDNPSVRIYIHDSNKDMFYELEDLRDIKDRSVIRVYEADQINGPTSNWDDQSYFSEPEFDGDYQQQHVHRTKSSSTLPSKIGPGFYGSMNRSFPSTTNSTSTLPRSTTPTPSCRPFSPVVGTVERDRPRGYSPYLTPASSYEDSYYSQFSSRSGSITPVLEEESRMRVENMERQLANLTGLVQKALVTGRNPSEVFAREMYRNDKSVSFEKSVSFSDEPQEMGPGKQHSPQHAAEKPSKPAIKSSTLPRVASQESRLLRLSDVHGQLRTLQRKTRDIRQEVRTLRRLSQAQALTIRETIRDVSNKIRVAVMNQEDRFSYNSNEAERMRVLRDEEFYNSEMVKLEKDLSDLESTVELLRSSVITKRSRVNLNEVENMALILSRSSKTVADLKIRFPNLQDSMKNLLTCEMQWAVREEKFLKEEPDRLEHALKRCKKLTGTLVTLKRLASVQEQRIPPAGAPINDSEPRVAASQTKVSRREFGDKQHSESTLDLLLDELQTFSKPGEEKITNPMAPMKRLPSYPSTDSATSPAKSVAPLIGASVPKMGTAKSLSPNTTADGKLSPVPTKPADKKTPPPPPPRTTSRSPLISPTAQQMQPTKPSRVSHPRSGSSSLDRHTVNKHSTDAGPYGTIRRTTTKKSEPRDDNLKKDSHSSSSESVNSQEGLKPSGTKSSNKDSPSKSRQEVLEQRHQELLRKQKQLQEQYARLQHIQRLAPGPNLELKKTGSESNIVAKMGLSLTTAPSGSLTHLASTSGPPSFLATLTTTMSHSTTNTSTNTTSAVSTVVSVNAVTATSSKIYETDII